MDEVFEWDTEKARSNRARHGVDFEWASKMFAGPRLEVLDTREDYGEDRYISIGEVEGRCLVVVHTPRDGRTRIISARKATRNEQTRFHQEAYGEG